jgi:hypothetical protein
VREGDDFETIGNTVAEIRQTRPECSAPLQIGAESLPFHVNVVDSSEGWGISFVEEGSISNKASQMSDDPRHAGVRFPKRSVINPFPLRFVLQRCQAWCSF